MTSAFKRSDDRRREELDRLEAETVMLTRRIAELRRALKVTTQKVSVPPGQSTMST